MADRAPASGKPKEAPYKSTPEDRRRAVILGIVYVLLAIAVAAMLIQVWPPTPWPSDKYLDANPAIKKAVADLECSTPAATPQPGAPLVTSTSAASQPAATSTLATSAPSPQDVPTATPGATPRATPAVTPTGTQPASQPAAEQVSPLTEAVLVNIPIKVFGRCYRTSFDERLILLVILAGILGSFVHGATSLADYIGNDNFNKNWTWFYLLRPTIGMALALVFYFVIRGGFLTTSGGARDINPYGIAALAGLVGMFSKQATDKLSEVFSTLFKASAGEGDAKRSGSLKPEAGAITVTDIAPKGGVTVGIPDQTITITGTNFVDGAQVLLNDTPQETSFESDTKLTVKIANESVATAGTLKLKVKNPDGVASPEIELIVSELTP